MSTTKKKKIFIPFVIFIISVGITLGFWFLTHIEIKKQINARFNDRADEITAIVQSRMELYMAVLPGAQGLFAASEGVTEEEWRTYVEKLDLPQNYEGITGVSYVERVPASKAGSFKHSIYPKSDKEDYYPITYTYTTLPSTTTAFGFDISSEEKRNATLIAAAESGKLIATPVVSGVTTGLPTFSVYAPVYMNGLPIRTPQERKQAFSGVVFASFRVKELFDHFSASPLFTEEVDVEIYDASTIEDASEENLLFDSSVEEIHEAERANSGLSKITTVTVGERVWTIEFNSLPTFDLSGTELVAPTIILVGGSALSILVAWLLYFYASRRERAEDLAVRITGDLQKSQNLFRLSMDNAGDMILIVDENGDLLDVNTRASAVLGYSREELLSMNIYEIDTVWTPEKGKAFVKSMALGVPITVQGSHRKKDGMEFPVEGRLTAFESEGKRIVLALVQDVTERTKSEKKLKERTDELERLNALMINRELKMKELKEEVARLHGGAQ